MADPPNTVGAGADMAALVLELAVAKARIRSLEGSFSRVSQATSDFSRLIIHDIRGAMSTMGLACDILRSGLAGAPASKYLDSIERAMTRTGETLDKMGDLIAIETGRSGMESSNVDARVILDRSRAELADMAAKSGTTVTLEAPTEPVMMALDSTRMTQALVTLADIALIFSQGASIELGLRRDPDKVVFSVVAPALQVASDQIHSLYARAWRGPTGKGQLQHGAALAVAIAQSHGGYLDVQTSDRGTRLELVIPTAA